MDNKTIIEKVKEYVRYECNDDLSAHDWWHIYRVYNTALKLNNYENGNEFVVSMIALLHDVYDWKFHPNVNITEEIKKLLEKLKVKEFISDDDIENICYSVSNLSFKGGFSDIVLSKEGKIAQDADRLDAMGAIVVARTFAYGGKFSRPIYNPEQGIVEITSEEEYKNLERHSINHFYEKLLKLKDLMNTKSGKVVAEKRHLFMEEYLRNFFEEWDSEDIIIND